MKFSLLSYAAAVSAPLLASAAIVPQTGGERAQSPFVAPPRADDAAAAAHRAADLTVDDFQAVQHAIQNSLEHAVQGAKHLVEGSLHQGAADADDDEDDEVSSLPHPPTHPLPPATIDLKDYTIFEIVNASLGHHHDHHDHHDHGARGRDAEWRSSPSVPAPRKIRQGLASLFAGSEHDVDEDKPNPHTLPLHRLAWLANFSTEAGDLLKQDGPITLLAPDDAALTPPHRKHEDEDSDGDFDYFRPSMLAMGDFDELFTEAAPHPFHSKPFSPKKLAKLAAHGGDGDDDHEHKKEMFKKLIAIVLKYHIVPEAAEDPVQLADRATLPTLLTDERVRVSPSLRGFPIPHPALTFNVYAEKRGPTILAKNGVIHLVSAPLLPPFTPLNQAFLTPQYFSALTNAVQKAGLVGDLVPQHPSLDVQGVPPMVTNMIQELVAEKGLNEYTIFAPSNLAFDKLGAKILAFLHSPFPISQKVLKYVLAYHVVPGVTFYSDFYKNDESLAAAALSVSHEEDVYMLASDNGHRFNRARRTLRGNVTHYELPTLLSEYNKKATLKVDVISYRFAGKGPIRREIVVLPAHHHHHHDHDGDKGARGSGGEGPYHPHPVKVDFNDVPARKGAIQVLGRELLVPPPPPHHHHDHDGGGKLFAMTENEAKHIRKALRELAAMA